MRIDYIYRVGEFAQLQAGVKRRVARAATGAIREGAKLAVQAGKATIAGGGLSRKWQSALHAHVHPSAGDSLHPYAEVTSKISYAGIFEHGGTIHGNPLLWLPLSNTPLGQGGKPMSPAHFSQRFGANLVTIKRRGGAPLLGVVVHQTSRQAKGKLTGKRLKSAIAAYGPVSELGLAGAGKTARMVPLYVGVPQVTDPVKTNVAGAVRAAAEDLGKLYSKYFEA